VRGEVTIDLTGVMAEEIGAAHGLSEADLRRIEPDLVRVASEIADLRRRGMLEVLDLPSVREDLDRIAEAAVKSHGFRNFVLLGIGGSSLGARAIFEACLSPFHNLAPEGERGAPRLFVAENVDPDSLDSLMRVAPPEETLYNVVSKSGTTVETISQLLVVWDRLASSVGKRAAEHLVITTDPERGFLRRLASELGIRSFGVPPGVGGRFSVLTPVGLYPAAVAGVDPLELLDGAAQMDERCRDNGWRQNPALALAGVHYAFDRLKGKGITVMMPYADSLRSFAEWFCQLWAESLGKRTNPAGDPRAPVGQTPVRALGAIDQHSQLQLYVDGPNDKLFSIVAVHRHRAEVRIPETTLPGVREEGLGHIPGHGLDELLSAERSATEMVLLGSERPVLVVDLPEVSAFSLGQMFYLYEWATIAAGMLYHVNPFDQPGVEEGKLLTHAAMGRSGSEKLAERIRSHRQRPDRHRIR